MEQKELPDNWQEIIHGSIKIKQMPRNASSINFPYDDIVYWDIPKPSLQDETFVVICNYESADYHFFLGKGVSADGIVKDFFQICYLNDIKTAFIGMRDEEPQVIGVAIENHKINAIQFLQSLEEAVNDCDLHSLLENSLIMNFLVGNTGFHCTFTSSITSASSALEFIVKNKIKDRNELLTIAKQEMQKNIENNGATPLSLGGIILGYRRGVLFYGDFRCDGQDYRIYFIHIENGGVAETDDRFLYNFPLKCFFNNKNQVLDVRHYPYLKQIRTTHAVVFEEMSELNVATLNF